MPELTKYIDVVIANEEDCQKALGISSSNKPELCEIDLNCYKEITEKVFTQYPNVKTVAITLRESKSANRNLWSASTTARNFTEAVFTISPILLTVLVAVIPSQAALFTVL